MATPVIGYRNILRNTGATITASSTASGYVDEDLADYRPWKIWKAGTTATGITIDIDLGASGDADADYIGLVNHSITDEAGTVEVKADNSSPPTTVRQAAYTPTYGDVDLKTFTAPGALRYWRITLAKGGGFTAAPWIGELFLGLKLTLNEHLAADLDPYLTDVEASATMSEGGQWLGSVIRGKRHRFDLRLGDAGAARADYTADLDTFIDDHVAIMRPFIFQLDSGDSVFKRPVYLRRASEGRITRRAVGGTYTRIAFNIPVEEAYSEAAS